MGLSHLNSLDTNYAENSIVNDILNSEIANNEKNKRSSALDILSAVVKNDSMNLGLGLGSNNDQGNALKRQKAINGYDDILPPNRFDLELLNRNHNVSFH